MFDSDPVKSVQWIVIGFALLAALLPESRADEDDDWP